jgi:hypothetical protein
MTVECDHTIGYLTSRYSPDEGIGSTYDLAYEFASDEDLAIYVSHHEMTKDARLTLGRLASGLKVLISSADEAEAMK